MTSFLLKTLVSLLSGEDERRREREKRESDQHRKRGDGLLVRAATPNERGCGCIWLAFCL